MRDGADPPDHVPDRAAEVIDEQQGRPATAGRDPLDLLGWVAFLLCALAFLGIGMRDGDLLTIIASVLFLVGVLFFLVPLLSRDR